MHKAAADDRYSISASSHVSAINRDAMQRAKSLLAQTCVHNANVTDDRDERAHMADVAVLAGAGVSIHLGHDSTPIDACGKVAR